jgi:hypothetical protein
MMADRRHHFRILNVRIAQFECRLSELMAGRSWPILQKWLI